MPDGINLPDGVDLDRVGFNLDTQKLHCLLMLHDGLASALSNKAGEAFFRAFVVESRETGEIQMNTRYRYKDGDSWSRIRLKDERRQWPKEKQIEYLLDGMEKVLCISLAHFAEGAEPPEDAILRFYPPNPDDSEATLDWLVAQDLITVTAVRRRRDAGTR
jgi:hypothetical protein